MGRGREVKPKRPIEVCTFSQTVAGKNGDRKNLHLNSSEGDWEGEIRWDRDFKWASEHTYPPNKAISQLWSGHCDLSPNTRGGGSGHSSVWSNNSKSPPEERKRKEKGENTLGPQNKNKNNKTNCQQKQLLRITLKNLVRKKNKNAFTHTRDRTSTAGIVQWTWIPNPEGGADGANKWNPDMRW